MQILLPVWKQMLQILLKAPIRLGVRSAYLKYVCLPVAVDPGESGIDGPADAPHVLYELRIARKYSLLVQLKKVLACKQGQG